LHYNYAFILWIVIPTEIEFVTQTCMSSAYGNNEINPKWLPELPVTCAENELVASENIYTIVRDYMYIDAIFSFTLVHDGELQCYYCS